MSVTRSGRGKFSFGRAAAKFLREAYSAKTRYTALRLRVEPYKYSYAKKLLSTRATPIRAHSHRTLAHAVHPA